MKIKNILNHHLVLGVRCKQSTQLIKSLNISSQFRILMKQGYTASFFFSVGSLDPNLLHEEDEQSKTIDSCWKLPSGWVENFIGTTVQLYNSSCILFGVHSFWVANSCNLTILCCFWWSHLCTEIFSPSFSPMETKNLFSARPAIRIAATVLRKYAWPILKKVGWFRTWGGRGKPLQKWQVFFRSPA